MTYPLGHEPGAQAWFYHRAGQDYGPMPRSELADALHRIPLDDVSVWHAGLPDWVRSTEDSFRPMVFGPAHAAPAKMGLVTLLFGFKGRIGRGKYLLTYCLAIAPYIIGLLAILGPTRSAITSQNGIVLRLALAPPFLWVGLALTAKRLHDLDRSAKHLIWIVPALAAGELPAAPASQILTTCFALGVELWLLLRRGTSGPNRFGPDPLRSGTRGLVVAKPERGSGGRFVVGVLAVGVIGIGIAAYQASDLRLSDLRTPAQVTCSRPEVVETTKAVILAGPQNKLALMIWLGGESNVRVSLTDIRTQSYDQPVNGVTCTASLTLMPIDPAKASNKDGSTSEINYTVQATDANDGHYVVTILE